LSEDGEQSRDASTEQLLDSMRREAEAEKEKIESEAAEHAAKIEREAEQELERIRSEARRRLDRELSVMRSRLVGNAEMEGRAERVRIKREMLDRVFDETRSRLSSLLESGEYATVLHRLVEHLAGEMEKTGGTEDDIVLEVPERDLETAGEALREAGLGWEVRACADTDDEQSGGEKSGSGSAAALTAEGLERVDNGIFTRLERARRLLAGDAASILFEAGPSGAASDRGPSDSNPSGQGEKTRS
jgi:vacuolar-type H+-ATPase subunit E/Vma4